jgi:hypothetical protein
MFDRWVDAQRIGIAAYRLGQRRQPNERLTPILSFLEQQLTYAAAAAESNVANLPPIILQLLCEMLAENIDSLAGSRPYWKGCLDRQLGRSSDERQRQKAIAPALGARILAHHFLHSTSTPLALMRLAHSMFRSNWRTFERQESSLRVLESSLAILRSPWKTVVDRIQAVDRLSETFVGAFNWPHVENALYHQFFAWPLLVPPSKEGCISLPVGVDIFFDDQAATATPPEVHGGQFVDERMLLTSTTRFDSLSELGQHVLLSERWRASFKLATRAAKDLWRGKHGNHGSFRERVEGASVRFDFTVADKIVAGFPELFVMSERSMEAYFAQCVLSRFLGTAVSADSIVTGEIGNQRRDEEGHLLYDYEFEWPGGIDKKLSYVFGTRLFERVILPDLTELNEDARAHLESFMITQQGQQSSEINSVKHLQHVSDSFQVGGWRQFRYVRCPELAWRIHPNGERLPAPNSARVLQLLEVLRANTSSVLELDSQYRPMDLASALWHINVTLREQIPSSGVTQNRP